MKFIREMFGLGQKDDPLPTRKASQPSAPVDQHKQPLIRKLNSARLNDRKIDELLGLCKGVVSDGVVTQGEAEFLKEWMLANREIADHWPGNVLFARIMEMLEDQVLDEEEQRELLETLHQIIGKDPMTLGQSNSPTSLPLCSPAPTIYIPGMLFCFTGKFVTGSRKQVEGLVASRGAVIKPHPTQETNYLVIGSVGSTDWIHSTHGRKIEKAVDLKAKGFPIAIVSEEHWHTYVIEEEGA